MVGTCLPTTIEARNGARRPTQRVTWKGKVTQVVRNQLLVGPSGSPSDAEWKAVEREYRLQRLASFPRVNTFLVGISRKDSLEQVLTRLSADRRIRFAEPNILFQTRATCPPAFSTPDDPAYLCIDPNTNFFDPILGQQYLQTIEADRAVNDPNIVGAKGGLFQRIAVLDTGADLLHVDLDDRFLRDGLGNIVGADFIQSPDPDGPVDDNYFDPTFGGNPAIGNVLGHGTHVSGIIAAESNNAQGVAGITWFPKIMPIKVIDFDGLGDAASILGGMSFAIGSGASVMNMSFGTGDPLPVSLQLMVENANEQGITLIAATGDTGASPVQFPARFPEVIGVGGVDEGDALAYFSTFSDPGTRQVSVVAPGVRIMSTALDPLNESIPDHNNYTAHFGGCPPRS